MFRSRCVTILFASLVFLGALLMPVGASAQGNSEAAHLCQNGGFLNYDSGNGVPFKNTGQCVRYAAQGGELVPVVTPDPVVAVSFKDSPYQNYTCTPVAHLTHFEPNTTYTVQQYIIRGQYTRYYPSFEVTTNETGSGTGFPEAFGIFSPHPTTFQMSVGDVVSDPYTGPIACY